MEPSQIFGVSEECHSSESGWTMYIGSPVNGSSDAASDDDEDEEHKSYYYATNNQDDSDDDSMASDASSGPNHHQQGNSFKGMKSPNGEMNFCLETKTKKPLMEKKKQRAEKKEVKVGQKPKSSVQSSSKVRKSILMGKRN
ncbi:protein SOB FIVE-LIKE 3-like [Benincasa hispida]|uniref:protein SOB FIVE-LIKE 3-like n=1 Tax=Benincasa hispida TaxID=102211 RepID=UPI0018FFB45D|nr:protein SOB FIVE-LIKE 3-like [Benincasa hispida]